MASPEALHNSPIPQEEMRDAINRYNSHRIVFPVLTGVTDLINGRLPLPDKYYVIGKDLYSTLVYARARSNRKAQEMREQIEKEDPVADVNSSYLPRYYIVTSDGTLVA